VTVDPSALTFLEEPEARRLAVAWTTLDRWERDEGRWAAAAGVSPSVASRIGPVLVRSGICRDDGTLDELARQYIAAQVQQTLPRRRR
jgi:hypothetical protein